MDQKNVDLLKRIGIFLMGFLGINLLALIFPSNLIYNLLIKIGGETFAETQIKGVLNFTIYFLLTIILLLILWKDEIVRILKEFKLPQAIKDGITIGIIIMAGTILYNLVIKAIFPDLTSNVNEEEVDNFIINSPFLSFFTVGIFAPICEELTYRYGLFGSLKKANKILAYIGTTIIFALIHFNFSTDQKVLLNELLNLPSYLFAAAMLCYAYDRNENLSCSIVAHATNNITSFVLTFVSLLIS